MKEIFIDGTAEYLYELKDRTHILYFNHGEQWNSSVRGQVILKIKDDGNRLKIRKKIKNSELCYMTALHLTILLKIIHGDYKFEIAEKISF